MRGGLLTPALIAGSILLFVSFGIRASYGVFQLPIADHFGWLRSEFSFAIALQNLAWGIGQPLFSMLAERFGDRKALFLGVLAYAVGLVLTAIAFTPVQQQLVSILVGCGIAGTGFGVVLAVIGRTSPPAHRSLALGVATAAGSMGQVFAPPFAEYLIGAMRWDNAFLVFAVLIGAAALSIPFLGSLGAKPSPPSPPTSSAQADTKESLIGVLRSALVDPNYIIIFLGFFACGFQLAFITAHFPAFITELCSSIDSGSILRSLAINTSADLGAFAIALIGIANIIGSILAGAMGKHYSKKYLLSLVYGGRTLASLAFILAPVTPLSVVVFSLVMGFLWLATIPLTSGLIAAIYGFRYMGTLYGIVFFSHQLGSFVGVWLGGLSYDYYGSYNAIWWLGIGVGLFSAVIHLPVREPGVSGQFSLAAIGARKHENKSAT